MSAQDGPRSISLSRTVYGSIESQSLFLPITVHGRKQAAETEALIDSGSMECLVSPSFVERVGMTLIPLRRPIILRNADESENSQGRITHYVVLKYLWQGAVKLRLQKVLNFPYLGVRTLSYLIGQPRYGLVFCDVVLHTFFCGLSLDSIS